MAAIFVPVGGGGGVGGSGVPVQVAFWDTASTIAGSPLMTWDGAALNLQNIFGPFENLNVTGSDKLHLTSFAGQTTITASTFITVTALTDGISFFSALGFSFTAVTGISFIGAGDIQFVSVGGTGFVQIEAASNFALLKGTDAYLTATSGFAAVLSQGGDVRLGPTSALVIPSDSAGNPGDNGVDLGSTLNRFRSGYFGTSLIAPRLEMAESVGDPGATANVGKLYTKDVAGVAQLFFQRDDASVAQIT